MLHFEYLKLFNKHHSHCTANVFVYQPAHYWRGRIYNFHWNYVNWRWAKQYTNTRFSIKYIQVHYCWWIMYDLRDSKDSGKSWDYEWVYMKFCWFFPSPKQQKDTKIITGFAENSSNFSCDVTLFLTNKHVIDGHRLNASTKLPKNTHINTKCVFFFF